MTAIDVARIARPEPKRDRFGRYMAHNPTGKAVPYTRATTIASTVKETFALEQWKLRKAIKGLASRPDLITSAQAHDPDDDRQVYADLVRKAMDAAESDAGATTGSALHKLTEDLDTGVKQLADIAEQWQPTMAVYQQALAEADITIDPTLVETVVLIDSYQIAGTVDRIVTMADGTRRIADLKTSKNVNFGGLEFAIQLAIYANHTATYNYTDLTRGPRVDVDTTTGLLIHLPSQGPEAGQCLLYDINLEAGYDALLTALEVREMRKDSKGWLSIHTSPQPSERAWLAERIGALATIPAAVTDLRNRWPAAVPQPVPDDPTTAQVDSLAAVLDRVEARHEIPFGPPRPQAKHQTINRKKTTA